MSLCVLLCLDAWARLADPSRFGVVYQAQILETNEIAVASVYIYITYNLYY